ncbi:MAG: bifunctional methyltransferase/pyrophosphohydrolase YabN [Chloroflexota bacterium]
MPIDITIVGLGPGAPGQLTLAAQQALAGADEVWLRTNRHPVVPALPAGPTYQSFDYLYEREASFATVYEAIVARLLELARRPRGVVYAVPGHPLVGERTTALLLAAAEEAGLKTSLVAGLSFLEPTCEALRLDPLTHGLQLLDAADLATLAELNRGQAATRPGFVPTAPLLVAQVYNKRLASAIKLHLLQYYPPDHQISLVRAAGVPGEEKAHRLALHRLDRNAAVDHLCSVYVPPLAPLDNLADFAGLRYVVARLRAPDGCPWDREQTHATLKPYLIEEAYEALDALDSGDKAKLAEEMGDVLLQVVLHAQLGEEAGDFNIEDVLGHITAKLIRRHPHVFGTVAVRDSSDVLRNWQQIKQAEKSDVDGPASLLGDIPRHMPALGYALNLQKRASRAGFDWPEVLGVEDKVLEELGELRAAQGQEARLRELGDLLFSMVNLARWLKLDAEEALRLANQRFTKRFHYMEQLCGQRGLEFARLSAAEQDELWREAKNAELD